MHRRALLLLLAGAATSAVAVGTSWAQVATPPPLSTTRFLAVGDVGSGNVHQRAVGTQMAAVHRRKPVDLVLLAGDNIYPSGDIRKVQSTFLTPYAELLAAKVPFHAVLGNHDIRTANGDPQVAYKPYGMKGRFYSVRRGEIEFFMLDTNGNAPWTSQLSWLRSALAKSQVRRHDQVEVALAIALLHIGQAMPLVRQGLQALAEHLPALDLHGQLTAIGAAQAAANPNQVAGIHQGGEVTKVVSEGRLLDEELDRTGLIGQGEKGELAHHAAGHHPAGHGNGHVPFFAIGQVRMGLLQLSGAVTGLEAQGIGTLAQLR